MLSGKNSSPEQPTRLFRTFLFLVRCVLLKSLRLTFVEKAMVWLIMTGIAAVEGLWIVGWYITLAVLRRQNYPAEIITGDDFPAGAQKFSFAYVLYHLPIVMVAVPLFGKRGAS